MMHWRFTLCVCTLSAVLLAGSAGGAIAAADPDADGQPVVDSQVVDSPGEDIGPTTAPVATGSVVDTSASTSNPSQSDPASSPGPMTLGATTTTEDDAPGVAAADMNNTGVSGSASVDLVESQSGQPAAASHSSTVELPNNVGASHTEVAAPATPPAAGVSQVIAPVTKAAANAVRKFAASPAVLASLPTSPTPITDVITALQDMLSAVGAVGAALAQVPSDLASLMSFPGMVPRVIGTVVPGRVGASLGGVLASMAVPASLLPCPPAQCMVLADLWGVASPGNVVEHPTLGMPTSTGLSRDLSVSGTAPMAPNGAVPSDVSSLKHTVGAVVVAASLTALAAVALSGIFGLLAIGGTGVRIGYRQAKAAATLRPMGIARFARSGPLGVVRSGSLIAVAPRRRRANRQQSADASLLETVA
jgi:hypothetical protein